MPEDKQNQEARGGANPDCRIKPECAAKEKLGRRRVARGIGGDKTGNDEEDFNAHPAEPCDVRGGRVENISGDMALKTRVVDRNPGPGPEYLMKDGNAESGGKSQRIEQWEMVLHGKSPGQ